ncbi:UNVERIFIED_CONTAM: protein ACTIVITY OF BC1 COMPLEX kinase, chloroplastic [Sesamum calycinum]|uniref:Protein ACTIVITY OF BC1 COMPLEX kinase, chloroplastic n=1 Tax=Sesamum calycinum TaxID=2727403 RepID=A0AAW2JIU7_9LAMI
MFFIFCEDLLAIAADQPFRFPATFTFVVRAFSVLDGIGKGLDPRFDITEIAKPKRWDRQSQAFYNLFRQADRVEKLAQTIQRLEQGDLKLRVGALESERAFQRVAAVQNTIGSEFKKSDVRTEDFCWLYTEDLFDLITLFVFPLIIWSRVSYGLNIERNIQNEYKECDEFCERESFYGINIVQSIASIYEAVQRGGNASMEIVRRVSGIYSLLLLSDILLMCMYAKQDFVVSNKGHLLVLSHINLFCVATAHPRRYFLIGIFATEAAGLRTGAILRTDLLML